MLTVKVFIESSGQIKNVLKDFNLYQGAYQDKLLNLYVPTAILLPNTTGVSGNAVYTACINVDRQGQEKQSRPYEMDYVKTLTYQGVEYALYERKLPKAFTMQVGTAKVVFNIKTLDLSADTPLIVDQIDSGIVELQVMASRDIEETPIEPSEVDEINARIDDLQEDVLELTEGKQDKEDNAIFDYTRTEGTPKTVVGALNNLDGRVTVNKNTNDTQNEAIDDLENRVADLEASVITGFHYVGTMTVAETLPTDAQVTAFVVSKESRQPQNGDKVIVVVTKSGATDLRYEYIYGASGWNKSEIPLIETAKNGELGIIEGTYVSGATGDTLVSINNGKIVGVYVKDETLSEYREIHDWNNAIEEEIADIVSGDTTVGKATKAYTDGSGRNIVDTYLTKTDGATKSFVKGYALPRQFNDRLYLWHNSAFRTTMPTSATVYSHTFSSIGEHRIFGADYTVGEENFELSYKNSFDGTYYVNVTNNSQSAQSISFRLRTWYKGVNDEESQLLCSDFTEDYEIGAGVTQLVKLNLRDSFTELQSADGDKTINVVTGDTIFQTFHAYTTSSASFTVSIGIGTTMPTSMFLQTQNVTLTVFEGAIEEYDSTADFPATGDSGILYVAKDENSIYRWNSTTSSYVKVSEGNIKIVTDSYTLIDDIRVPNLSGDAVTLAYNGLVSGKNVTVEVDGFMYTTVTQAIDDVDTQQSYIIMACKDLLLKYDFNGDITRMDVYIAHTEDTMNTSTLPAYPVPELSVDQVEELGAYVRAGKNALVRQEADTGEVYDSFAVIEDNGSNGICLLWYGLYLHYYVDDETVICEYTQLGGRDIDVNYKSGSNLLSYSGDTVTITERYKNIQTGATSTRTETVALANSTTAGLMSPSTVTAIQQMRAELDQLEGQSIRLVYTLKDNPTATEIGLFVVGSGYVQSQFPTIGVVVKGTNHIWRWYNNTNAWQDIGVDTVNQFTNTVAGVIKGSQLDGQVYAEDDGTGSVVGWDTLQNTLQGLNSDVSDLKTDFREIALDVEDLQDDVSDLQTDFRQVVADVEDLQEDLDGKQNTLLSGVNIKTINNTSLLGSGNITISGGGIVSWGDIQGDVRDNRELFAYFEVKQDELVSGRNIKTINNTSILGSGNITISGGGGNLYLHRLIIYCHKGSNHQGANLSLWFTTNSATPVNSFERLKEIAGAGLYSKIPAVGCYGTTYDFAEAVYNTNNHLVAVWFYSENYLEVDIEDPIEGAFGDLLFNANQVTIGDYVKQL